MRHFTLFLKLVAPVFVAAGALHLVFGVGADVMLGAKVSSDAMTDPALDSQNRFYGVAFTLYGVLLYLYATDIQKYAIVLRCVLWVYFAAGAARLLSIATLGTPPPLALVLLAGEILPPPLLIRWLSRVENGGITRPSSGQPTAGRGLPLTSNVDSRQTIGLDRN